MKKNLLFVALLIGSLSQLTAQCTITPGCSTGTTGYCTTPAANSSLPNGTVSTPYSTTIQISIASSLFGGLVTVTNAQVTGVTGLPSGLSYSVNPTNGNIPGGSDACMLIEGIPGLGTAGTYTIVANVNVVTSATTTAASLSWQLTIDATAGVQSYNQISNFYTSPNPATSELSVSSTSHFEKIQIADALGKIVISHNANYTSQTTINISTLSRGLYFIQISDGTNLITKKFIKD